MTVKFNRQPDWDLPGMEKFSECDIQMFKRMLYSDENPKGDIVYDISCLGWAFWPTSNNGYLDSDLLRKLADFLETQNKPFWDGYEEYCAAQEPVTDEDPHEVIFLEDAKESL